MEGDPSTPTARPAPVIKVYSQAHALLSSLEFLE